jgi:hypothetical protein
MSVEENAIADLITSHLMACMTKNANGWRAEVTLEALLEAVDSNPPERVRLCDVLRVSVTDTGKDLWK